MQENISSNLFSPIFSPQRSISFSNSSTNTAFHDQNLYNSLLLQDHQDTVNRKSLCLSRLRQSASEAAALQRENVQLRTVHDELNQKLRALIQSSLHKHITSWTLFGDKETERIAGSGRGSPDDLEVERFLLPKSISVKSDEYSRKTKVVSNGGRIRTANPNSVKKNVLVRGGKEKEDDEQVRELEAYKQGAFKTELCNKWQQTGACPYGDHCQFAHGVQELRPVIRHPRYKTELCRMVLAGVACPYGHRCHFLHTR
ncbi:hypothetical protein UlMin_040452 [Ulmus minor]